MSVIEATADQVDPRNTLNELSNKQWMLETKSVWFSEPPPRDALKVRHPATFAESDVARLIEFFTRSGQKVLDPFVGSGSALVACAQTGRLGTGVELVETWVEVCRERLKLVENGRKQRVILGDAREVLRQLATASFDFVVTSPPYWTILRKDWDHKVKAERKSKSLSTRYSDKENDLGNLECYETFLQELGGVFSQCARVLKRGKYLCVIVSDFRHGSRFFAYHADVSRVVESVGLSLEGITILVQDNKGLYPYGIPFAFVSNIHHQYILVFRSRQGTTESGAPPGGPCTLLRQLEV